METDFQEYLSPTEFLDYNSERVQEFATRTTAGITDTTERIIQLYLAVRDGIRYDTYQIFFIPEEFKASATLKNKRGFCVQKSLLFAAAARLIGVPARMGYADVCNHLATEKIAARMRSDVFVFHGYVELYLNEKWVKATPVFNDTLCQKLGVQPLEFDGTTDSIFQEFDPSGNKQMEYLHFYGTFADLPYEQMKARFKEEYPHLFEEVQHKMQ